MMYQYQGMVFRVIDGDTVEIVVDLGFRIQHKIMTRLAGINAPEMSTPEGHLSRFHLRELALDRMVGIQTVKDRTEKYGRYLVWLWTPPPAGGFLLHDASINMQMIRDGFAVPYPPEKIPPSVAGGR